MWVNFYVPDLVSGEVAEVAALLKETITTLCIKDKAETQCLLQAPEYLFVSTRVASAFPDLLESIVIRTYESYLPGQLSRKWRFGPGKGLFVFLPLLKCPHYFSKQE